MYANFIIGLKSDYALCSGKHALKCRKACTKTPCIVHYIIGIYTVPVITGIMAVYSSFKCQRWDLNTN